MKRLDQKVALVTGGSRGIGAAIAKRLAQEGADVALTYVSAADKARAVVAEIEAAGRRGLAILADSADPDAVVSAVERTAVEFGRLDILVNNAGIFPFGPFEDVTLEEVDRPLAWAFLVGVGPLEIVWAIALKYTDGFIRFPLVTPRVTPESFEFVFGRATQN